MRYQRVPAVWMRFAIITRLAAVAGGGSPFCSASCWKSASSTSNWASAAVTFACVQVVQEGREPAAGSRCPRHRGCHRAFGRKAQTEMCSHPHMCVLAREQTCMCSARLWGVELLSHLECGNGRRVVHGKYKDSLWCMGMPALVLDAIVK